MGSLPQGRLCTRDFVNSGGDSRPEVGEHVAARSGTPVSR